MIYRCYFCHNPIKISMENAKGGKCETCPHRCYTFFDDQDGVSTADIVLDYKDRRYTAYYLVDLNMFCIYDEKGPSSIESTGMVVHEPICKFLFIPEITPGNILSKFPTLLVFS